MALSEAGGDDDGLLGGADVGAVGRLALVVGKTDPCIKSDESAMKGKSVKKRSLAFRPSDTQTSRGKQPLGKEIRDTRETRATMATITVNSLFSWIQKKCLPNFVTTSSKKI